MPAGRRIDAWAWRSLDFAGGLMFAIDVCLSDIEPGQVLGVSSTNRGLEFELPAWCRGTGDELLDRARMRNALCTGSDEVATQF
jgi:hypothetical protein